MNNCKRCEHLCHCNKNDEHKIVVDCDCIGCNCKPKAYTTEDDFCVGDDADD